MKVSRAGWGQEGFPTLFWLVLGRGHRTEVMGSRMSAEGGAGWHGCHIPKPNPSAATGAAGQPRIRSQGTAVDPG